MKRGLLSTTGLLVALLLFVVFNLSFGTAVRAARVDLTENGLYTLSEGTQRMLSKLDQKIRLRYYFTRDLVTSIPDLAPLADYAKRVQELIEEYVAHSDGKVSLEIIDPPAFSEEEDDAVAMGLSSPAVNAAGDRLFFGLVATNEVDDQRAIPFFHESREEFLEYDVSELISEISRIEKPVVGVISSLPVNGGMTMPTAPPQPPWFAIEQLQRGFETRDLPITSTTEIPEDVDIVVVVHPKNVSAELQYALDQFVLKGGKLIAFVDPHCWFDQDVPPGGNPMMAPKDSNLNTLFDAWGVELVERKLAGDRAMAQKIPEQNEMVDFLVFPALRGDCISETDVVTGDLELVSLLTPGILRQTAGATTSFEPLLRTTTESQEIDPIAVQFGPSPSRLLDDFVPSGERYTVAARVSGPAKSAFPDGKPASAEGEEAHDEGEHADEAEGEDAAAEGAADDAEAEADASTHVAEAESIQVIVVADADLLQDQLWVRKQDFYGTTLAQMIADNGAFLLNAVENMSGDADLISLRSRGRSHRPFLRKEEIARAADEEYRAIEQRLEDELRETERQLADLQQQKSEDERFILSPEQEEAIARFENRRLEIRKELRDVRYELRKDIDRLGRWLKFVNIALVPLLVAAVGAAWVGTNSWRRKHLS